MALVRQRHDTSSPDEVAAPTGQVALDPVGTAFYGEPIQFGRVLPWR